MHRCNQPVNKTTQPISGDDISGMKILVQYSRFALFSILSCLKLNVTVDINCAVRTIKGVNRIRECPRICGPYIAAYCVHGFESS